MVAKFVKTYRGVLCLKCGGSDPGFRTRCEPDRRGRWSSHVLVPLHPMRRGKQVSHNGHPRVLRRADQEPISNGADNVGAPGFVVVVSLPASAGYVGFWTVRFRHRKRRKFLSSQRRSTQGPGMTRIV